jgi:hypothetical protein
VDPVPLERDGNVALGGQQTKDEMIQAIRQEIGT